MPVLRESGPQSLEHRGQKPCLVFITGEDYGVKAFRGDGYDPAQEQEAIREWEAWWQKNQ